MQKEQVHVHVNERCRRKEEPSKVIQRTKQHNTPKVVNFLNKNDLPRVGFEPTTLCTPDMYIREEITHIFISITPLSKQLLKVFL